MRQFHDLYAADEKVSPLVTLLPWTHNLIILGQAKRPEEREFYLRMSAQERWSKRELEAQFRRGAFERAVLSPPKLSTALREIHGEAAVSIFKDAYLVEFLNLPDNHSEADLHRGLLQKLQKFLIEPDRDFCYVGTEYPVHVGSCRFPCDHVRPAHLGRPAVWLASLCHVPRWHGELSP